MPEEEKKIVKKRLSWKERQLKAINSLSDPALVKKLASIVMQKKEK